MDAKIFDRIEKKYLITKAQKNRLLKTIKKNTCLDFINSFFNSFG
jgi:ABC-type microcin C transport system permease subunit YejB